MLWRSTLGILAFAALLAPASASVVSYRLTGTFTEATDDYEALKDTSFTYDFSFDTDAANIGNEYLAQYELLSTDLHTAMGDLHTVYSDPNGYGGIDIDLDPSYGSMTFGAYAQDELSNQHVYGLTFADLEPQKGDLPGDLEGFAADHKGMFLLTGFGPPRLNGVGTASTDRFTIQQIQSVPEPASLGALAVGASVLLRRRRSR
jgi:hypothetical protein